MCLEACLPQSWWEFAVVHATHVYNRMPIHHLNWQTPFSALNDRIPDISHLRVFGCGAYVHIPKETHANFLAPKSELMVYLGHTEGIKASLFMCLPSNQLFTSDTAVFDEAVFPKCDKPSPKPGITRLKTPCSQNPPEIEDPIPGDFDKPTFPSASK